MIFNHPDIVAYPDADPQWLVHGLIAKGERVLLYGEPGTKKSWLLCHLAASLVTAQPFLNHYLTAPGGPVLYIDEEMSTRLVVRRWKRVLSAVPQHPYTIVSLESCLISTRGMVTLRNWIRRLVPPPVAILFDAFRRVVDGSENNQEDVARFWRQLSEVGVKENIAVIVVHHDKKAQDQLVTSRQVASGSYDMIASPDLTIHIACLHNELTLEVTKAREIEEPAPFQALFQEDPLTGQVTFQYRPTPLNARVEAASSLLELFSRVGTGMELSRTQLLQGSQSLPVQLTQKAIDNGIGLLVQQGCLLAVRPGFYRWTGKRLE